MPSLRSPFAARARSHTATPVRRLCAALALVTALIVSGSLSYASYQLSERAGRARLDDAAQRHLDLYATTLQGELKRHAILPGLIEADTELTHFLRYSGKPADAARINQRLTTLAARASVISLFLADGRGLVIAANDWRLPNTFYGSSVGERFVIDDALAGKPQHYVVMREPGSATEVVFIHPFMHEGTQIGLIGFRISLDALESTWRGLRPDLGNEQILVVDEFNLVILSSAPAWKLAGAPDGQSNLRLASPISGQAPYIVHERGLGGLDWKLQILSSLAVIRQASRNDALGILAPCGFMVILVIFLLQRRKVMQNMLVTRHALQCANALLEENIAQRTVALRVVTASLMEEVGRREQAQSDLHHAGRLAFLGQMSASVSHEIGQPLTALRALVRNARIHAERSNMSDLFASLAAIGRLAERIGRISMQLKSFAYRGAKTPQRFNVHDALNPVRHLLVERCLIEQALKTHQGQPAEVCAALGIARKTLYDKLHCHGFVIGTYR